VGYISIPPERGHCKRGSGKIILYLNYFLKLFKNQQFPFAISKIFYTFAVQKVGLLLCECITC